MERKREYWQSIRGICILAVVLIHSLGGFDYTVGYDAEFIILRQVINFAVATFVFMSGYFVPVEKICNKDFSYKDWILNRGGRLGVPFVIWSLLYSGISLAKDIHHGVSVNWLGYVYRFVVGKAATPFYYIVVLIQLTVITPWLVNVVKDSKTIKNFLWLITPCLLLYIYVWNLTTGYSPRLYETLFPAWFGFYYLGINVRCGLKLKCSGGKVLIAGAISCVEALALRKLGMSVGFYTSQITVGSFLYSIAVIGWILKQSDTQGGNTKRLGRIGDCSYGIFYVHMAVLTVIGKFIQSGDWYLYWGLRFAMTSIISFTIILAGQKILKKQKKLLRFIGLI